MKMNQNDYATMRDAIKAYLATVDVMVIARNYSNLGHSPMRLRWDIMHASGVATQPLYNAGLNDNHIDTALTKIIKELT
jgi:hypothetical protein